MPKPLRPGGQNRFGARRAAACKRTPAHSPGQCFRGSAKLINSATSCIPVRNGRNRKSPPRQENKSARSGKQGGRGQPDEAWHAKSGARGVQSGDRPLGAHPGRAQNRQGMIPLRRKCRRALQRRPTGVLRQHRSALRESGLRACICRSSRQSHSPHPARTRDRRSSRHPAPA